MPISRVNPEYLRRNLIHCKSIGAHSCIQAAILRLRKTKRPQKWLLKLLMEAERRAGELPDELSAHRSEVSEYL